MDPSAPAHGRRAPALLLGAVLAGAGVLLASCASSRAIVANGNPHAWIIDCSGASLSWSHCYRKAGRTCPRGYTVVQKPYKQDSHVVSGDFLQLLGNSSAHRRMLVTCRSPDLLAPAPSAGLDPQR